MAREIMKKLIDEEMKPADDFDEKLLENIEREFEQMSGAGGSLGSTRDSSSLDFDFKEELPPSKTKSFSLDDFEATFEQSIPEAPAVEEETASKEEEKSKSQAHRRIARNKLIMMLSGSLLLLCAVAFLLSRLRHAPETVSPHVTQVIKRPIEIPHYQEKVEFLILAASQQEKSLILLGVELDFPTMRAKNYFMKENITFRDMIYQFLDNQHPLKNSLRYWQKIVEKDLLDYLNATFPDSGMRAIRIDHLDRL